MQHSAGKESVLKAGFADNNKIFQHISHTPLLPQTWSKFFSWKGLETDVISLDSYEWRDELLVKVRDARSGEIHHFLSLTPVMI